MKTHCHKRYEDGCPVNATEPDDGFVRFARDPKWEKREQRRAKKLAAMSPEEREAHEEGLRRRIMKTGQRALERAGRLDEERIRRTEGLTATEKAALNEMWRSDIENLRRAHRPLPEEDRRYLEEEGRRYRGVRRRYGW